MSTVAELGYAALLAGLPGMGPSRLTALLDRWPPAEAWARATSGAAQQLLFVDPEPAQLAARWASGARAADPEREVERHAGAGVEILLRHDPRYPEVLAEDLLPPAVLFARGDLDALAGPRAAIVGTRRCTGAGAGVARELGHDLAAAGVVVVSGLALGIDGAAHRGALQCAATDATADPVGVVGSGLDVPYPSRHADLWAAVAARGVLMGEAPLGVRPAAWRFPARNRIIAALADVVVVVESHAAGGSLLTVAEAIHRDVPVLAVPGSVRSPAAAGTNQLIAEGCHPVRDADDVLVALGLVPGGRRARADRRTPPDEVGQALLDAFDWEPATLEHLVVRSGLDVASTSLGLQHLLDTGWVACAGSWYERIATPGVPSIDGLDRR